MKQTIQYLLLLVLFTGNSVEAFSQHLLASPHFLEARKKAADEQKRLLVHFTASWSNPCSKMFSTSYRAEEVNSLLRSEFVFTLIDIDDFDGHVLGQHYNINNLPTLVLFDHSGRVLKKHQGKLSASELLEFLKAEQNHDADIMVKAEEENKQPGMMERINNTPSPDIKEESVVKQAAPSLPPSKELKQEKNIEQYYAIQLGAFSDKGNAEKMLDNFTAYSIPDLHLQSERLNDNARYLLLGGKYGSRDQAEQKLGELRNQGKDGFIKLFNLTDG